MGKSFYILNKPVGCCQVINASNLDAKIKALLIAMHSVRMENRQISRIFIISSDIIKVLNGSTNLTGQTTYGVTADLRHLLLSLGCPRVDCIPRNSSRVAQTHAYQGIKSVPISMFHIGMDMPRWLMKVIEDAGFNY
ncbi:hypothetical protein IHE45_09G049900 [Dioscorea alata]|uniref:Uncharacterized protein n=1 Tax=Dioscorea alata TaxID=55571 RepID=A0ACB7VEQ3_DIOAL|nr:hypothetical protein IHE45_09G049900 [Dioscorea alata]